MVSGTTNPLRGILTAAEALTKTRQVNVSKIMDEIKERIEDGETSAYYSWDFTLDQVEELKRLGYDCEITKPDDSITSQYDLDDATLYISWSKALNEDED